MEQLNKMQFVVLCKMACLSFLEIEIINFRQNIDILQLYLLNLKLIENHKKNPNLNLQTLEIHNQNAPIEDKTIDLPRLYNFRVHFKNTTKEMQKLFTKHNFYRYMVSRYNKKFIRANINTLSKFFDKIQYSLFELELTNDYHRFRFVIVPSIFEIYKAAKLNRDWLLYIDTNDQHAS